ncbi:hypothetical protein NPX13_g10216 [Xylaria arbuscula]|uniref:Uncharacterized protein n=1 Tax=Xylaria arbuscula TaxID=114810 RepID=A0A9W8N585_9PEZI|nr:hypothetical protein NPX13_g10216 [Xylaria arbuscula]
MVQPRPDSEIMKNEHDELYRLLLSPYREIAEKAKVAIENAANEGDSAPSRMIEIATQLLRSNERLLAEIDSTANKYFSQYGNAFIDAIKSNDDIAQCRSELEDLLWDFDDYTEVDVFDANRFEELGIAAGRSAQRITDILRRLKLEPVDETVQWPRFYTQSAGPATQSERISTPSGSDLQSVKPAQLGKARSAWMRGAMKALGRNDDRKTSDGDRKPKDVESSSTSDPNKTLSSSHGQVLADSDAKPQTSLFRPASSSTPMDSDRSGLPPTSLPGAKLRSESNEDPQIGEAKGFGSQSVRSKLTSLFGFPMERQLYTSKSSVHPDHSVPDKSSSTTRHTINELRDIGVSERAIRALRVHVDLDGPSSFVDRGSWLLYLAHSLGDTYSGTKETAIVEDAVHLYVEGMKNRHPAEFWALEWLSNQGPKLTSQDKATNHSITTKTAIFEWEIPRVFSRTDSGNEGVKTDLRAEARDFVVLSGSDGAFEATTCAKYVEDNFGGAGLEVLDAVIDALVSINSLTSRDRPKSPLDKSTFEIKSRLRAIQIARASQSCITLTTQATDFDNVQISCMKWLCEAVRLVPDSFDGKAEPGPRLLKSTMSACLRLGAYNAYVEGSTAPITAFSLQRLQRVSETETGTDCCWVNLFKTAVVAWRSLKNSWGTGLRLNYEMLVRLAAVTNYAYIDGSIQASPAGGMTEATSKTGSGLIAVGFFTALIPIAYDPFTNSTQWHLEVARDSIINPEELRILDGDWLRVTNPKIFMESQCFLGWKGNVQVTLGTEGGCYDFQWTDLPRVERVFRLEGFEIGGEIGTGDILPISLKHTGNLSFKACSTVQSFTASAHYEQALRLLSQHVALVYDSASQIAWLIPQLSWNLHLCHVWYRHVHGEEGSDDPIPFARMTPDGAFAAGEALHRQGDLAILEGLNLSQLFLQIYRNMSSSNRNRQKPTKSRVLGPEVMDLIEEPGRGSPLRKLDLPEADQSWQYLVSRADTIGFCKGLGQALTPQDWSPDHTCGCDTIPLRI